MFHYGVGVVWDLGVQLTSAWQKETSFHPSAEILIYRPHAKWLRQERGVGGKQTGSWIFTSQGPERDSPVGEVDIEEGQLIHQGQV